MTTIKPIGVVYPSRQTTHTAKLPILLSCRLRLSEEQRNQLKAAYRNYKNSRQPEAAASIGGSTIKTVTSQNVPSLVNGWSDLVISDLISSRETTPLTSIIQIQEALSVEVVTPEQILEAAKGYIDYCFNHSKAN